MKEQSSYPTAETEQLANLGENLGAAMESVHLNLKIQPFEKEPANTQMRSVGPSVPNEEESEFGREEPMEMVL